MTNTAMNLSPAEKDELKAAKRLAPRADVLRELYMLSGNRCANPGCAEVLIDTRGTYVGEVAHIHAASNNGPRAKPSLSDEERRAGENLMLLCPTSHKRIDKAPGDYPADMLLKWKAQHENIYKHGIKEMLARAVSDLTQTASYTPATTLNRVNISWNWNLSPAELAEDLTKLEELAMRLRDVPQPARDVLAIMVRHGEKATGWGDMQIGWPLLKACSSTNFRRTEELVSVLMGKKIVEQEEEGGLILKVSSFPAGGPDFFAELNEHDPESIDRVIRDLDFSVLD